MISPSRGENKNNILNHLDIYIYIHTQTFQVQSKIRVPPKTGPVEFFQSKKDGPPEGLWLVVSTPLKNISQIGNLPKIGVNIFLKPPPKGLYIMPKENSADQ